MYLINASDQYHPNPSFPTPIYNTTQPPQKNISFDIVSILKSKLQMKAMKRSDYDQPNTVSRKVANEQQAIASQVRRYKQNYMNKVIQANNLQTFIKFSKELFLLLISHCKNILCVAPQKVNNGLEEISVFFDDIINKYYQASLKLNDRFAEAHKSEGKLTFNSELCAVCSQQIKKVEIDQTRRCIFNESLAEKENCDEKKEEDDMQFFADLNDLLNRSHGELLKNQIEIDIYQDVALNAIKSLSSLKSYFSRDSIVLPSNSWMQQAQIHMKKLLKENFNGKIPAWIEKMFMMFWSLHRKDVFNRSKEEGVQTVNNTNSEILELKKKIHRSIEKLQKTESRIQLQDHEMVSMAFEKKDLEIRVDYYKKELNKLIDEIEAIKSENQSIKLRLTTNFGGKESQTASKTQLSSFDRENVVGDSSRSRQRATHRDSLPKIQRSSFRKNTKKRESLTSIKIMQSQIKSQRDSTVTNRPQKLSLTHQQSNFNDQPYNNEPEPTTPAGIREYHNDFKDKVIQEEQAETLLEDEKKRIEEVNRHIKNMVKNKFEKHGLKRYFSNTLYSDKTKESLKRIPRRTNKMEPTLRDSGDKHLEKQSIYSRDCKQKEETAKVEKINNILMKIYNYLKDQGFLIKLTQEQFKESISKINELDMSILVSDDCQRTLQNRLTLMNNTMDRLTFNRKVWNAETFHISKDETQRDLNTKQQEKNYFSIFTNEENAFNYEVSLTKNHFKGIYKMSKPQEKLCVQFYEIITSIKTKNFNHYKFICSYLRYPFQVMKNDFGVVNIVNQMKYENFHQYFQRLMGIHTKCKKQEGLCAHFQEFKSNLLKQA